MAAIIPKIWIVVSYSENNHKNWKIDISANTQCRNKNLIFTESVDQARHFQMVFDQIPH